MIELSITEQSIDVSVTEQQVDVNVNTSVVDINSSNEVIEIVASTGIIYNANSLAGLSDVSAASPSDGDVLQYVSSTNKWTKTSSINFGTW